MLFRQIIAVYGENHTEHVNTLWCHMPRSFCFRASGTYSYRCAVSLRLCQMILVDPKHDVCSVRPQLAYQGPRVPARCLNLAHQQFVSHETGIAVFVSCAYRCDYVGGVCALLGHYAAYSGNSLPTFRYYYYWNFLPLNLGLIGCPEMSVRK